MGLWLVWVLSVPAVAGDGSAAETFVRLVHDMQAAGEALQDATWTLHSREWVRGGMKAPETMEVKFRRPLELYMRWISEPGLGRELLYREGWNKGRMRVNPEGLVPPVNLDPTGGLAMRDSRHPVMRTSILSTIDLFVADLERLRTRPGADATATDLGVAEVHGEPSHCLHIDLPRDQIPELYADEIEACFSLRTALPTRSRAFDLVEGALRMVEEYEFEGMRVNVGLTDADFDPDNPQYSL